MAGAAGHAKPMPRVVPVMDWFAPYVGLPFGDGPGQLTCWGLVRRVYADRAGVDLPAYGEISAKDLIRVARAMAAAKDDGWLAVSVPQALDVALMRSGRGGAAVVHVGVMVDNARVLHVEAASAAVVVPIRHHSIAGRIVGYRRLA